MAAAREEQSSMMGPPSSVPLKRRGAAGPADDNEDDEDYDAARRRPRLELGEELPDEVSEQDIQQMLEQADDVHIEVINESALKRMVMQLERKIKHNQAMRIKHADEPDKFLKSEVDLDEEVKRFSSLTTHPELYGDLVKLEAIPQLVGLLNHVNTDIAVDVFEVLSELTDPDVMVEVPEPEAFVKALFDAQLCQMTVDTLIRIDESASEEDAKAVTNCLTMLENLADISPEETCSEFSQAPRMLPWLIKRVRAQGDMDYNRVYAAEILGIVLQNSAASREAMVNLEGVDKLLRGIAGYRKKDPTDSEESEYVQNMFDCLCSLMLLPDHQVAFGKVQGLELMIRMMQQHNFSSPLAVRLADHAVRHCPANCQIFVEKVGLKVLFPMFMKKGPKAKSRSDARELEEHVASIIQSLCRYCTGTAVARVLNKFMESGFEKLERLMEMHDEYARAVRQGDSARLQGHMQRIDRELQVDDEEQLFLDRCDAGLFTLQQVDIILVRLANMGNRQATEEISKLLDTKGVSLEEICDVLEEYCSHLDSSAAGEREEIRGFLRGLVRRCATEAATVEALERRISGAPAGGGGCSGGGGVVVKEQQKRPATSAFELPACDGDSAERERDDGEKEERDESQKERKEKRVAVVMVGEKKEKRARKSAITD